MNIAKNIKKLRQELCLNKTEFAKEIGISRVTISQYESGERQPSYPTVRKIIDIAKKYGIKINPEEMRVDK